MIVFVFLYLMKWILCFMHALNEVTKCEEIVIISIFQSLFSISSDSDTFFDLSLHITVLTSFFYISKKYDSWSKYVYFMTSCMSVSERKKKNFLFKVFTFFYCVITVLMTSVKSDICSAVLIFVIFSCTHFMSFHIIIDHSVCLFTFSLNSFLFTLYISFC